MEIYKQIPRSDVPDVFIVDYMNQLIDDRNSYKDVYYEKISKMTEDLLMDIRISIYNVDRDMLEKFKDVYDYYPRTMHFNTNIKRIEKDKQLMLNLLRRLKINKIKNLCKR